MTYTIEGARQDYSTWRAKPDQSGGYSPAARPETKVAIEAGRRYPYFLNSDESRRIGVGQLPGNGQTWWFADAVRIGTVLPIDPRFTDFREIGAIVKRVRNDALSLVHQSGNLRAGLTILGGGEGKPTIYRGQVGLGSNKTTTAFFARDDRFPNPTELDQSATLVLVHTIARGEEQTREALRKFAEMGYEERDSNGKRRR